MKLSQVHFLFEVLIKKYLLLEHNLKDISVHVHCPHFENGIVKTQNGKESKHLRAEADAVKIAFWLKIMKQKQKLFLVEDNEAEAEAKASELSFVDSIFSEAEKQAKKKSKSSNY